MYSSIGDLAAEYGADAASEVAEFEVNNLAAVQSFIEKEGIECDLDVGHIFDVQLDDAHCAKVKAGYDLLVARGLKDVQDVEFHSQEAAETVGLPTGSTSPLTIVLPGVRCQRRSRVFPLPCWSIVAIQTGNPDLETNHLSRCQSSNQYTRVVSV